MSTFATTAAAAIPSQGQKNYNHAIGYLRAFIVADVVAHHAALAYTPFAPPTPTSLLVQPPSWQAYPVVDRVRAVWAGVFVSFNDIFFMALLYFVSGLFVWQGLTRKGVGGYMRDRWLRLGLPFLPAAFILAPLAYYPTWLQIPGHAGFGAFLGQFFRRSSWSAGPLWFVWLLLVFDCIATALFSLAPEWGRALGRLTACAERRPAIFFAALVVVTATLYIPLVFAFNPFAWTAWGPFSFQTSRILLYLAYFAAGIAVGAQGLEHGLLAAGGSLARRWALWVFTAACTYLGWRFAIAAFFTHPLPHTLRTALASLPLMSWLSLTALSCAASGFAAMAVFVRFANRPMRLFKNLAANSYGIFLVHYVLVSFLGYWVLPVPWRPLPKFLLVFGGSLALSWIIAAQLRRVPAISKII